MKQQKQSYKFILLLRYLPRFGEYTGEGYANGIKNTKSTVVKATNDLGDDAINSMLHKVTEGGAKINAAQKDADDKSINEKTDYWSQYLKANQNGVTAQTNQAKAFRPKQTITWRKTRTERKHQ